MSQRLERRRELQRRRPVVNNPMSRSRPDRVAAWALLLGIFLILLAATTSRGDTGGVAVPAPPATKDPAPVAPSDAELGERVLRSGSTGEDVRTLQAILRARHYGDLKLTGVFDDATTAAVKRFQGEAGLAVDGVVGPQTRPPLVALMRYRRATWYGPGLYGNKTACGSRLRRDTLGVAHKSLPCGTPVTFYRGGRFITVPVIDRGPFRNGVAWDLTAAAARKLGMASTTRLRSVH